MDDSPVSFGCNMEGSITPPVSPREDFNFDAEDHHRPSKRSRLNIEDVLEHIKLPIHWDCSKHHRRQLTLSPAQDGYLQSGTLNRLLNGVDQCSGHFDEGTCELFGHVYVTGSALIDNMAHLFALARQAICKCERLLGQENSWSAVDPTAVEACRLRDQVLMFLLYIQAFLHRYDPSLAMASADQSSLYVQKLLEFPVLLLQEIKVLCMYIGRLTHRHGPLVHQYALSQHGKDSSLHILLHIHLDLQWNILQVLHLMHTKHIGSQYEDAIVVHLNSHVQKILQELVTIAIIRHNSRTRTDSTGPFVCNCHHEMWTLLIHFLDYRHGNHSSSSFWCSLHSILIPLLGVDAEEEHITQDADGDEDRFPKVLPNDKIGVCWWILRHVASLYQYNRVGQLQCDKGSTVIRNHWILAEDLFKVFLTKDGNADESKLQCYLKYCLALSHLWEPHNKLLTMLWDYFKQRLNTNLHVASLGVQNLPSVCKSAQSWFDLCKQRTTDHTASQVHENSFNIFLRILATQLIKMKESGSLQGWKQIQGRFYSKFHSRSMKELNEVGLNRFLSLFITLALVADLSDVSSRVLDFLDLLPQVTLTPGKHKLIWKGLFALCLVHEEHQIDISVVADKLNKEFQPIAREFTQKGIDSNRRGQLWGLIACYIESTQDVFEASNRLNLSEEKLIGHGFHQLLAVCSEHEMRLVLNFFQTVMARHRGLYKRVFEQLSRVQSSDAPCSSQQLIKKYVDLAQVLWQCVFPFVRQHATTQTPPSQLADVAASFTLLASDMEGKQMTQQPSTQTTIELFKYFGLENKAHYSIRVRYMCHLLPNQTFVDKLQTQLGSNAWPAVLIQAWFGCGVQCAKSNNDQMQELTRLVAKIPQVTAILETQISDMDVYLECEPAGIIRFIIAAGYYFNGGKSLQERFKRRQEILNYFGDLVPLMQSILRNQKSSTEIQWLYRVMGHVVKHCAAIIYVKGKAQSQLPQLLSELVLPHVLYNSKKAMSSGILNAIRDNLHLFLEGLGSLGIQRDEFIQRKLQELVEQYFHRFQVKVNPLMSGSTTASMSANHPILVALHKSCSRNPSANDCALRQFILPVIQQQFLAYQGQSPPPHLSNTVNFLQELFQKTLSTEQIVRDTVVLLGTVLDYIFLCNVASAKRQMSSLLTFMMDACRKGSTDALQQDLLKVLRGFLLHHIHTHQGAVIHCLESVAVLHPDLMTKLIPDCSLIIGQSESKRGVGVDSQLRNAYCALLSHLGEEGRVEMRRTKNGDPLL